MVEVDETVRPQSLLQFLPRNHPARTLQQNAENLKRLTSKFQLRAVLAQFSCRKVNFEIAEAENARRIDRWLHRCRLKCRQSSTELPTQAALDRSGRGARPDFRNPARHEWWQPP